MPSQLPTLAVYGLWHLGCVTAASLAQAGYSVYGLDRDPGVIEALQAGRPPIFEPGLTDLIDQNQTAGRLIFTVDPTIALAQASLVWVAFDTPVDAEDRADIAYVERQLEAIFPYLQNGTIVLISSQLPVGFTAGLRQRWQSQDPTKHLIYAYSPENLRLGQALKSFQAEDRIVIGLDSDEGQPFLEELLGHFTPRLEWMSVKSAEMTKHALNSFLAVSVAMINEIARICERVGADAKEVERGLKSERRIGPRAYLGPGAPFAGGTLARDLRFLVGLGQQYGLATPLLSGTLASNELHKDWVRQSIIRVLAGQPLNTARLTILGLTYKASTDTLRRSEAVDLGLWLADQGATVVFHDPVIRQLPAQLAGRLSLAADLPEALRDSDVVVVMNDAPLYKEEVTAELVAETMRRPNVVDQSSFLAAKLGRVTNLNYLTVGSPGSQNDISLSRPEADR